MEHQPSTLSNQPRPSKRFVIVSWALVAAWAFLIFFMSSNTGTGLNTGLGIFSSIYRAMQAVQEQLLGPGGGRAVVHRALLRVHDVRRASGQRAALPHAAASCVPHRHRLCQLVRGERRGSSTVRARAHVRPGGLDGGYCGQRAGFRDHVRGAAKKRCPLLVKARVSHRSDGGACFPMGDFVADVLVAVLRQQEARCRGKGIRQFRDDG